jgi:hypothetical protein
LEAVFAEGDGIVAVPEEIAADGSSADFFVVEVDESAGGIGLNGESSLDAASAGRQ